MVAHVAHVVARYKILVGEIRSWDLGLEGIIISNLMLNKYDKDVDWIYLAPDTGIGELLWIW